MRINKYIASCGIASRRSAEVLIKNGKISINGEIANLGDKVGENDIVKLNNKIIEPKMENTYILLNKPIGYTCTTRKFKGEKNILELINEPRDKEEKFFPIGRLDKNSSGLIILTNDGDLSLKLTHPRYEHEKEYAVTVNKKIPSDAEKNLIEGVKIENEGREILVMAKKVKRISDNKLSIIITEGKKRQIRKMIQALGLEVIKLKRTRISGLSLGNLAPGKWRYLKDDEVKLLTTK